MISQFFFPQKIDLLFCLLTDDLETLGKVRTHNGRDSDARKKIFLYHKYVNYHLEIIAILLYDDKKKKKD